MLCCLDIEGVGLRLLSLAVVVDVRDFSTLEVKDVFVDSVVFIIPSKIISSF
jgi:hypothetical protein